MITYSINHLDNVLVLLAQTSTYCNWTIKQVATNIIPPIDLKQCIGIVEDNRLKAWVSWAYLPKEKKENFLDGMYTLKPNDWASGPYLVFMDFVAPFGHSRRLHRICRNIFPEYPKAEWRRHLKHKRVGVNVNV